LKKYLKQLIGSKRLSRIGAVSLVLSISLFLVSCDIMETESTPSETNAVVNLVIKAEDDHFFREDEWIRMLTLAISNLDDRSTLWSSIPTAQRSEITLSDFIMYTDFLSASIHGAVKSYSRATEDETETILGHVIKTDPALNPSALDASVWWLHSETTDRHVFRFAIPVTLNEQGIPYFSKSWLQKQSMLYQYIVLYLEAVEMRNEPALKSLIRQNSSIKSTSHDESLNRRVSSLIELYPRYVISGKGSYRIIEMVPGFAAVEQQGLPPNGQTQLNRTVTFVESEGVIAVNEKFPQWLAPEDAILYHDDRPLFGSGQTNPRIESEREIPILGVPLDLVVLDDSDKDARLFRVVWPGLTVEAVGTCDVASLTFSGKVRQVSATYTQFRTGSGLKPGASIHELYKRYPFIREQGYIISRGEIVKKTLSVQVETDFITRLTITIES